MGRPPPQIFMDRPPSISCQ